MRSRGEAKNKRGEHNDARRKQKDCAVQTHSRSRKHAVGNQARYSLNSAKRKNRTEEAAEKREKKTLGQQLPNDAAAAGSEGNAQRDFPRASGAANKKEVCNIRAGDQEHKHDRAKEH